MNIRSKETINKTSIPEILQSITLPKHNQNFVTEHLPSEHTWNSCQPSWLSPHSKCCRYRHPSPSSFHRTETPTAAHANLSSLFNFSSVTAG